MSLWKKLKGTTEILFGISLGGAKFKSSAVDEMQVRNNADSAYARLKVAAPQDDSDVVTKKYADTIAKPSIMADQVDTSASIPNNTAAKRMLVVTTAGTGAVIGDLLYDDGSSTGTMEILGKVNGRTIATLTSLSGGTVSLDPDSIYLWDDDASSGSTQWVKIGDVGSSTGAMRVVRFLLDNSANQDSVSSIPANAIVHDTRLVITTSYSGGATISIGRSGSTALLQATTDNNPQASSGEVYSVEDDIDFGGAPLAVKATIGGAPAAGAGWVVVLYSMPDA